MKNCSWSAVRTRENFKKRRVLGARLQLEARGGAALGAIGTEKSYLRDS